MAEEGGMDFVQNPAIRALLNTIESSFHLSVEVHLLCSFLSFFFLSVLFFFFSFILQALEKAQQLLNKQKRRKVQ